MRARASILLAAAVLMAAGCSDTPTEPAAADALFDAGKSPNKGFVLLEAFDQEFPDYLSCVNGGAGGDLMVYGHYETWGREVTTPSGNTKWHGELRADEYMVELATGDVWDGLNFVVPTIFYNTRHSDGYTILNEPAWGFYENQRTGEIIRAQFLYHVVFDADFQILRYDVKYLSCKPWKGQVH